MTLRGATPERVRAALADGDPLPGTTGFAGAVEGTLVRDILGRQPLFVDETSSDHWSFDPGDLDSPVTFPAGHCWDDDGIRRVWDLPRPDPLAETAAIEALRAAIRRAVSVVETESLAIGFSGGLDSALLAALLDAPLYVVGFPDSHDVEAARTAAGLLGAELTVVELDHDMLEAALPGVVAATGRRNAMDVQIALPLFLLGERVAADGFESLALGQGADELFGGYAKVARAPTDPRVEAETVAGARREVLATLPDQFERDVLAIRGAGVEPVTPLAHDAVVRVALALPGALLVTDRGERKWALRLAAREWLPDEIVFREKKAVQYGSLVARELDRLARQAGFKRRLDDHVGRYVRARCDSTADDTRSLPEK